MMRKEVKQATRIAGNSVAAYACALAWALLATATPSVQGAPATMASKAKAAAKPNPLVKVKGQKFVMPGNLRRGGKPMTKAEGMAIRAKMLADYRKRYGAVAAKPKVVKLPKLAKTRGSISRVQSPVGSVYGKGSIFQYVNADTSYKSSCGQAALATLMVYWGIRLPDYSNAPVNEVCRMFPPGFYGRGDGGTWSGTLERAFSYYGLTWTWQGGSWNMDRRKRWEADKSTLKSWVSRGYPVMVPVDVAKAGWTDNGQAMNGLHWTNVFAYDDGGVYLTNWQNGNYCPWPKFMDAWQAESVVWTGHRGQMMLSWRTINGREQSPPAWPPGA